jgi:3-oxoadipate enol-lactonase
MTYAFATDGCRIAYDVSGAASLPPLLLVNSLGTTSEMWGPQMSALTPHYRVIRYDSRGHGASDVTPGDYTIELLGRDALAVLDSTGISGVALAGVSLGGMIGQWLAINAPARLSQLALCNTAAWMGPAAAWQQRIEMVLNEGMEAVASSVVERWFTPGFRASRDSVVASVLAMLRTTDPAGYAGCCAAIRDNDQREEIRKIGIRTLVIGGTLDPATPAAKSHELKNGIAESVLVMLPTAHLSNLERPEEFNAALLRFLMEK